ncbi:class I SAM-dependent methyltransferase [Marinihelvus fidelis]|uniref:Class I SAM-dependent methyltransferase n=1 Tax=Marinihelvus fidelis TaxID=2613842 RepID=A0A5N0T4N6_9GAMM|nr:class I SAM-dependent methyltransferase [Marinihelvus fidelis]KAA9129873.1 class I SAM-dependent methyltransferase [Marinihelvus fidelis]
MNRFFASARNRVLPAFAGAIVMLSANAAWAGNDRLDTVLAAQPEDVQARYVYRHPAETLAFFGIEPGMTVVEALPGGGWYSKILVPYLGPDGTLVGANYDQDIWPLFGFFDDAFIATMSTWVDDWPEEAGDWVDDGAAVQAFELGSLPDDMAGSADAVLMIRALHNMQRFQDQGGFLDAALADTLAVLKPGGIVGVVQHEARPERSDEFADGSHGYLKKADVIALFEQAGFEFVAESDINQNPADQPGETDIVWRLPPSFNGTGEDPEARAAMQAIGESNRMTLKFRKPE